MRFPCSTGVLDLVDCVAQNPYWMRLTVLLSWYLIGIPIAYMTHYSCNVGAPGIWAHAGRVFIEGIVVFALGASIYVGVNIFRVRFVSIFGFAGAGPISTTTAPFLSGIIAVHRRGGTFYSSRRISVNLTKQGQSTKDFTMSVMYCLLFPYTAIVSLPRV